MIQFQATFCFQTSSLPFTSGLLSCSLWLRYGMLINENTIIFVNSVGVFLFSIYCITYYMFTVNKRRMSHQLLLVFVMITFSLAYSKVEPDDIQASRLIGTTVSFISFAKVLQFSYRQFGKFHLRFTLLLRWRIFLRQPINQA